MSIDLSGYVEVSERITMFREKYPEGSFQTEIVPLPDAFAESFIAVRAFAYRTPGDERPGVDLAWEPVPGKTPYTKDSELMNACTSAIGRAIVAVGAADTKRGVASADEVRNRQGDSSAPPSPPRPLQASEAAIVAILDRLRPVMVGGDYPAAWREARVAEGPTTYRLESLEQMVTGDKTRCSQASAARMNEVLDGITVPGPAPDDADEVPDPDLDVCADCRKPFTGGAGKRRVDTDAGPYHESCAP